MPGGMRADRSNGEDRIYAESGGGPTEFAFDERVAAVFDDMAERSIPLYRSLQEMCVKLATRHVQPCTRVLDLGCSTATTFCALVPQIREEGVRFEGIDNSPDMLARAERKLAAYGLREQVELRCADVANFAEEPTSVAFLLFTLQFVPVSDRLALLEKLRRTLVPGGVLVLAEKVKHVDDRVEDAVHDLYLSYKESQGYSKLEIARKREALENVLIPETLADHEARCVQAGFSGVELISKWTSFATWLLIAS